MRKDIPRKSQPIQSYFRKYTRIFFQKQGFSTIISAGDCIAYSFRQPVAVYKVDLHHWQRPKATEGCGRCSNASFTTPV